MFIDYMQQVTKCKDVTAVTWNQQFCFPELFLTLPNILHS